MRSVRLTLKVASIVAALGGALAHARAASASSLVLDVGPGPSATCQVTVDPSNVTQPSYDSVTFLAEGQYSEVFVEPSSANQAATLLKALVPVGWPYCDPPPLTLCTTAGPVTVTVPNLTPGVVNNVPLSCCLGSGSSLDCNTSTPGVADPYAYVAPIHGPAPIPTPAAPPSVVAVLACLLVATGATLAGRRQTRA